MWTPPTTMKTNRADLLVFLICTLMSGVADQGVKYLFSSHAMLNTGISFSFLSGLGGLLESALILLLIVGIGVTWHCLRVPHWSQGAFWGAAISNMIDRFWFGGVRDVWYIPGTTVKNNLADWLIAAIAVYWMWYLYRQEQHDGHGTNRSIGNR